MTNPNEEYMAFVDIETTGIRLEEDHLILEIGVAVVSRDFEIVDTFSHVIWTPPEVVRPRAEMALDGGKWVMETHTRNGLLLDCVNRKRAVHLGQAEDEIMTFVRDWFGDNKPPMCGSSVGFDRGYITRWMPHLNQAFHYRNIDISSVKELCRRLNPALYAKVPEKRQELHRVIPDLEDSVLEAQFYADNFLFQEW